MFYRTYGSESLRPCALLVDSQPPRPRPWNRRFIGNPKPQTLNPKQGDLGFWAYKGSGYFVRSGMKYMLQSTALAGSGGAVAVLFWGGARKTLEALKLSTPKKLHISRRRWEDVLLNIYRSARGGGGVYLCCWMSIYTKGLLPKPP